MKLIAIAGCSGSGKSELARALESRLGDCALLSLDSYYHPLAELSVDERAERNFDHPDALDWVLLEEHVGALLRGESVETPVYLFDQHTRAVSGRVITPARVVLVEGILTLHRTEIRTLADLCIYVDTSESECLRRRVARDVAERGRTEASVLEQHYRTVWPMALEYVLPSRAHADIVVSGERAVSEAVEAILLRWPAR